MSRKAEKSLLRRPTDATELSRDVEMAFITALLLVGSPLRAEACVIEGLHRISDRDVSGQSLLRAAIRACFAPETTTSFAGAASADLDMFRLPAELQDVLLLPTHLRRCFVLRLLVGMTRAECSRLLSVAEHEVDEGTTAAIIELSRRNCR